MPRYLGRGLADQLQTAVPAVQQEMARYLEASRMMLAIARERAERARRSRRSPAGTGFLNREIRAYHGHDVPARHVAAAGRPGGQPDRGGGLQRQPRRDALPDRPARRARDLLPGRPQARRHAPDRGRRRHAGRHRHPGPAPQPARRGREPPARHRQRCAGPASRPARTCLPRTAAPSWPCWAVPSGPSSWSNASTPSAARCRARWSQPSPRTSCLGPTTLVPRPPCRRRSAIGLDGLRRCWHARPSRRSSGSGGGGVLEVDVGLPLRGFTLDSGVHEPRRRDGAVRPLRLRQDHGGQLRRRAAPAGPRSDRAGRPGAVRPRPPHRRAGAPAAGRLRVPGGAAVPASHRAAQPALRPLGWRGAAGTARGWARWSSCSGSAPCWTAAPATSRAASASGSRSGGPCWRRRGCC